ncbi:hypothetical protein ELY11_00165 [Legionella septentrionalis]|nr:hypothetical protein ELY11_00165 [Legionella septentrionalis]RUR11410.1 hypothetical protein ELY14_01275 [Legionella septentrionalis]
MKISFTFLLSFLLPSLACSMDANTTLLPEPFPVYFSQTGVANQFYPGMQQVLLPTDNTYKGNPGCYILCYTRHKGLYPVSPGIYATGQIRVKGTYVGRLCRPHGYERKDISNETFFKQLCKKKIPTCRNLICWAGGDSGGWFGIQ